MLESQPDVDVCAVQVSGLQHNHTHDFISLYFENKRSGGGPIDDLVIDGDKGTAVITFASSSSTNLFCYIFIVFFVSYFGSSFLPNCADRKQRSWLRG